MLNSPKHLTWAFLVVAAVLTVSAVWSNQAVAEPLSLETLNAPETKTEEIPELREALTRFQAGDVSGTKKILDKAVENHPKLPPSEVIMAQFFAAARQAQGVRLWLQRAIQEHPASPDAYVMLGQMDAQGGQTIEAWLLFEKANSLLADSKLDEERKKSLESAIQGQLAQLAMSRKNWDEAKKYLQKLLDKQPDNAAALQLLGRVLFEEGKPQEALEKLQAAKAANEKVLTPQAIMAQWYEADDDRSNAAKSMTEALTIAPKDFETRMAAAKWAFVAKDFAQAMTQAEAALKLEPDSIPARLMVGNIAIFQHNYPTAEKYLREAWEKAPSNFAASNNLALALCEQDDADKLKLAQNLAKMNAQMYQNEAEAFSTLGRVLYKSERLREAEQSLRKAVSLGKAVSPDTAYYMAVILADTERQDDAKKLLQSALKSKGLFAQRSEAEALLQRLSQ